MCDCIFLFHSHYQIHSSQSSCGHLICTVLCLYVQLTTNKCTIDGGNITFSAQVPGHPTHTINLQFIFVVWELYLLLYWWCKQLSLLVHSRFCMELLGKNMIVSKLIAEELSLYFPSWSVILLLARVVDPVPQFGKSVMVSMESYQVTLSKSKSTFHFYSITELTTAINGSFPENSF